MPAIIVYNMPAVFLQLCLRLVNCFICLLMLTSKQYCSSQSNSSLTSLNLHGCKRISDKGLNAVSNLPLKALSLGLTRVKDEGMAYLARLTQLTELHCTNEVRLRAD